VAKQTLNEEAFGRLRHAPVNAMMALDRNELKSNLNFINRTFCALNLQPMPRADKMFYRWDFSSEVPKSTTLRWRLI
jgi:hypothetical protein